MRRHWRWEWQQIFSGAFGPTLTALWYHFAIMFEALFILTTVDTGTRVGRFMFQELAGHVVKPLGRTSWYPAMITGSAAIVAGWGWFLIQGVTDPMGGINALWPLFGISNQLLAAVALSVGTTLIIRRGQRRHMWVTLVPLAWLLVITTTASWQKIFATDPRIGFLSQAASLKAQIAAGAAGAAATGRLVVNAHVNATLCGVFLLVTWAVVLSSARGWLNSEPRTPAPPPSDTRAAEANGELRGYA